MNQNQVQWFHSKRKLWIAATVGVGSGILIYGLASKYGRPRTLSSLSSLITASQPSFSGNSISPWFGVGKDCLLQRYGWSALCASSSVVASRPSYLPSYSYITTTSSFSATSKPGYLQSCLTRGSDKSKTLFSATSIRSYGTRSFDPSKSSFFASTKPSDFKLYATRSSDLTQSSLQATSKPTCSGSYVPDISTPSYFQSYVTKNFDLSKSSFHATSKPRLYYHKTGARNSKYLTAIISEYGGGGSGSGNGSGGFRFSKSQCQWTCFLTMAGVIIVCNIETVPYSKRKHVVLVPRIMERNMGESAFADHRTKKGWRILPEDHPATVKLRSIVNSVTEVADKHVDGMNWKLYVVDEPNVVNACCYPGGIVVVFTGLLRKFKTTNEIATVIGHEVGHAIARHGVDNYVMSELSRFFRNVLSKSTEKEDFMLQICMLIALALIENFCIHLPRSRKFEMEADYVGLLLMASAGYDPRIAPKVYKKLGDGGPSVPDFFSTHPEGIKRSRLLSKHEVMQEALAIYEGNRLKA